MIRNDVIFKLAVNIIRLRPNTLSYVQPCHDVELAYVAVKIVFAELYLARTSCKVMNCSSTRVANLLRAFLRAIPPL